MESYALHGFLTNNSSKITPFTRRVFGVVKSKKSTLYCVSERLVDEMQLTTFSVIEQSEPSA